jgi:hypothetical protein
MGYTQVALEDKILDMYPEVREHGISLSLTFSEEKNAWVVKFKKDRHELTTNLDKQDADECMDGIKCVHLGIKINEFLTNFEAAPSP